MAIKQIIACLAFALAGPAAALPDIAPTPLLKKTVPLAGPTVVVLWATWCVSCRAELARLASLERAAAPMPVATLAIDPPGRALDFLVAHDLSAASGYADARDPRAVLDDWGGPGTVLPVAVAIGRTGRICGRRFGLLGTDQLREWASSCLR